MCSAYGTQGHPIQERTVLVGYACRLHSGYSERQDSSARHTDSGYGTASHSSSRRHRPRRNRGSDLASVQTDSTISTRSNRDDASKPSSPVPSLITESATNRDNEVGPNSSAPSSAHLPAAEESHRSESRTNKTQPLDKNVALSPRLDQPLMMHSSENPPMTPLDLDIDDITPTPKPVLDVLRARLLTPQHYLTSLKTLEYEIWLGSSIDQYCSEKSNPSLRKCSHDHEDVIRCPDLSQTPELREIYEGGLSDEYINSLCGRADQCAVWFWDFMHQMRICRNMLCRTYLNMQTLRQQDFCSEFISLLVVEDARPNVAELKTVSIEEFVLLVLAAEKVLRDCDKILSTQPSSLDMDEVFADLNGNSRLHSPVNLHMQLLPFQPHCVDVGPLSWLPLLAQMVDLAVVSYAGAHLSDFTEEYLHQNSGLDLVSTFGSITRVRFQQCALRCLDQFHHMKPVWVFTSSTWECLGPLYVSAKIDVFADIWGPLWKEKDPADPARARSYVVGSGAILPWRHNVSDCSLLDGEVFCHWMSDDGLDEEFDCSDVPETTFNGTETLLIGAITTGKRVLSVNKDCRCSISESREHLRNIGRLCVLGTEKPYRFNDGTQYQLQVGYSGINAAASKQYKRAPGQPLKSILVELWAMEPDLRDPQLLDDLYGLEVSLCTYNSQRISLSQLLGFKCMRSYLRKFNWGNEKYESEYFRLLLGHGPKTKLSDNAFRVKFEKAVMICLNALKKTGLDRKENLQVFLSSLCTPKPELATLVPKEHSWARLLRDTSIDCTMAAFGDTCLEFKYSVGVTCGGTGKTVLRTAIVPNQTEAPLAICKKRCVKEHQLSGVWTYDWDISSIKTGTNIWLGENGTLSVVAHLADHTLLVEWRSSPVVTAVKSLISRAQPHREFSDVDHSEQKLTRPIPVFVISEQFGED